MRPPAVPVVGQANQDTRLTPRVLDDASVDLNARYRPGDGRAMGRIRGNRVAIGLVRKRNRGSVAIALLAGVVARLAVVRSAGVGRVGFLHLFAEGGRHFLWQAAPEAPPRLISGPPPPPP